MMVRGRITKKLVFLICSTMVLIGCGEQGGSIADKAAWVDGERISNADAEPQGWLTHGRTYSEQRYSPLDQISTDNVGDLGLAWYLDLDTSRGQQASAHCRRRRHVHDQRLEQSTDH